MTTGNPAAGNRAAVWEFEDLPSVGPLLARAALGPARRRGTPTALPDRTALVADHAQEVERLAAYTRACGLGLRDAVPATWLHVLTFPLQVALMAERDFPFALPGLIHVRNTMTLHHPVGVRDRLRLTVRATDLAPHRRGTTFDLVGEAGVGGETAWVGRSTYLAPSAPPTRGGSERGSPPEPAAPLQLAETGRPPESAEPAGFPAVSQWWRLPTDLGRRYAAASGDVNPIHLNPLTARLFGFRRPIAHGMWTHARALAALGGRVPARYTVAVTFTRPIPLPGHVGFGAAPTASGWSFVVLDADGTRPHLRGTLRSDPGEAP